VNRLEIAVVVVILCLSLLPSALAQTTPDKKTGLTTYTDPATGLVHDIPIVGYYCIDFSEDSPCFANGKMIGEQTEIETETTTTIGEAETPTEGTPTKLIYNCTMPDPTTQCFTEVLDNGTLLVTNGKPSPVEITKAPDAGIQRNFEGIEDEAPTTGGSDSIEEEDESDSEYCDDNDNDGYCDDDPSICIDDDENDVCDVNEVPTMPDTSPINNWMNACSTIQQFLYHSCDAYVNFDGTLTDEGGRAVVCIRNGAVLAVGGTVGGVPPSIAADILGGLAEMTGCGGIVDMQEVKRMVSLGGLTDISSLSKFLP
jgi:hypothetical protein